MAATIHPMFTINVTVMSASMITEGPFVTVCRIAATGCGVAGEIVGGKRGADGTRVDVGCGGGDKFGGGRLGGSGDGDGGSGFGGGGGTGGWDGGGGLGGGENTMQEPSSLVAAWL